MANEGNQGLLGRLAVHKKLISMDQLVQATAEQGRFGNEHKRIGEILVEKGFLSPKQLQELLALQRAFLSDLSTMPSGDASSSSPVGAAPRRSEPAPRPKQVVSRPPIKPLKPGARAPAGPPVVVGKAPAAAAPAAAAVAPAAAPAAASSKAPPAAASPFGSGPVELHPSSGHSPFAASSSSSSSSDELELELDVDRSHTKGGGAGAFAAFEPAPAKQREPAPPPPSSGLDLDDGSEPALAAPPSFGPGDEGGGPSLELGERGLALDDGSEEIAFAPTPTPTPPPSARSPSLPPAFELDASALGLTPLSPASDDEVPDYYERPQNPFAFDEQPAAPPAAVVAVVADERRAPPAKDSGRSLIALSEAPAKKAERLDLLLSKAARGGASDVHLHAGAPAKVRKGGALVDFVKETMDARLVEEMLREGLNAAQQSILDDVGQVDFAYPIEGIGRFRANVYRGLGGMNGVFRFVPSFVPSLVQLGLPMELGKLTTFHQGLVLVTGPAGCGKSTTLAALVNIINEEREDHILTIEDPVEYLHPSKRCLVNQRQVSRHTESFARALRAALREDPDVIVIGELRDLETISLALTAAETGHLVLGTLHTSSAIRTINRLIGAYPPEEQPQIRAMMSESLRAIISQRLLPKKDGSGRICALEVLHVNKAVANTVRENKSFQLRSMMQTGRAHGMLLLDQSLGDLVRAGVVAKEEAARHVEDPRFLG